MSTVQPDPAPAGAARDPVDFLRATIAQDVDGGRFSGRVQTRFPPEPNGYLHIGHAKSICIDFGVAAEFGGECNLRFDDTNPAAEEVEYVDAIQADIRWLGFDWEDRLFFASDYFEQLYAWAEQLVQQGDAYVDDLSVEEMREHRGSATQAARPSPYRDRSPAESLDLLRRMRAGEFEDGARTLRARIDPAAPNMNLRDPVLYRIDRTPHHRTGTEWCIYPTYDWAHGQSDSVEGITHSLCTLEFENHRPLYDWFLERLGVHHPRQIEFSRLELTYTLTSKRRLLRLVEDGHVSGWDDPRMPTLRGLRRRGYTPEAVRALCAEVGITKYNSTVDMVVLENALRADLNRRAQRRMAVLRPLELVIENWPEGQVDEIDCVNNPEAPEAGTRKVPFSGRLWIERDDFREEAPRKYHRLKPGQEVRLRYAYYVTCTGFDKDPETGAVTRVRCTYDPESRGGDTSDGRKVRGTIHWVCAASALDAEVRLYDHLFAVPEPGSVPADELGGALNPDSLEVVTGAKLEPSLAGLGPDERVQFERQGYFCVDSVDSRPAAPVFNRAVSLKDSWAKIEKKATAGSS